MRPRRQSLLSHGLSPYNIATSHATSWAKPAQSRAVALKYSHKPCDLAGKACSVTGCRPIKKQKNKFFYVRKLPTKFVFRFFAWLVAFGNLCLTRWGWGWYTVQAVFGEVSEWFKEPVLKTGDSERGRGFESHLLRLWYFTILYILNLFSWRSTQVAEGAPLERE